MLLNRECERAMRYTIPAVRIAAALELREKHNMSETTIAKRLGVAQPAVSKYFKHDYSKKIGSIVKAVVKKGLQKKTVDAILKEKSEEEILTFLDDAASDSYIITIALKNELLRAKALSIM